MYNEIDYNYFTRAILQFYRWRVSQDKNIIDKFEVILKIDYHLDIFRVFRDQALFNFSSRAEMQGCG